MCGIICLVAKNPSEHDFNTFKKLMLESKIRGMHATGVSFINKFSDIETITDSVDSEKFIDKYLLKLDNFIADDGNLYLIGHTRYSTSSLEFNQPISNKDSSVSHNGVISQEPKENWDEKYGVFCVTSNDSEMLLYSESPLIDFHNSSIASCILRKDKSVMFFRNGKRPLYFKESENSLTVFSTADIGKRSTIVDFSSCECLTYYSYDDFNLKLSNPFIGFSKKDLQVRELL